MKVLLAHSRRPPRHSVERPPGLGLYLLVLTLLSLAWLLPATPARSAGSDGGDDGEPAQKVAASLIAEPSAIAPGEPFWVSLRQDIVPHWHTYWRNPGDSGQATYIDWALPDGFRAEPIAWPVPQRIPYGPLMNYGYENRVDLLVRIHPPADLRPGDTATLRAEAEWLVCADICIPEYGSFELALPVTAEPGDPEPDRAAAFHAARAALPSPSPWPVEAVRADGRLRLAVAAPQLVAALRAVEADDPGMPALQFFPGEDGVIVNSAPQEAALDGDRVVLSTEAAPSAGGAGAGGADAGDRGGQISGLLVARMPAQGSEAGVPVVQGFAFEASLQAGGDGAVASGFLGGAAGTGGGGATFGLPDTLAGIGILEALLLALAGGIILNLMPCVFPVIAMKALGLAEKAGAARRTVRLHGLAYAAGVLLTFAAIGGALLLVKAGGAAVGWGFQLQSPVFVALMAYLMLAVGLNLSGLFTVGEGMMGLGQGGFAGGFLQRRAGGHAGAFLTGVLASAVAAPCTAPFMATAIGFALTRSAPVAMAVLMAVGLGMAIPYLLLTWVPGALRFLPRPGAWMERLRQVLAFPMYAAAAWLVWVLSQQAGPTGVIVALGGGVLLAFAFWLWQAAKTSAQAGNGRAVWRLAGRGAAAAVLVLAVALTFSLRPPGAAVQADAAAGGAAQTGDGPTWERYSAPLLAELQAAGRPVFVNFTAAWCITCEVNEQVALSSSAMRELFEAGDVAYLKGDWTNQDPEITRMLERFGRSGVPLYVLFAPDGSTEVLPQILTEAGVAAALRRLPGVAAGTAGDRAALQPPARRPSPRGSPGFETPASAVPDRPAPSAGPDHA